MEQVKWELLDGTSIGICILDIELYTRAPIFSSLSLSKNHNKSHPYAKNAMLRQLPNPSNQCYPPTLSQSLTKLIRTSNPHSDPTPQLVAAAVSSHPRQGPASLQTESPSPGSTCPLPVLVVAEAAAAAVAGAEVVARGCASVWGQALVLIAVS